MKIDVTQTVTEMQETPTGAVDWMEQAWLKWTRTTEHPTDPKLAFIAGMLAGLDFAAWVNHHKCACNSRTDR